MFEAAALLGICDKIVPGLLIGALRFGHLPAIFVPAGPMPSGLANKEKQRVRQLYAEGKVGRAELLEAEAASYHGAGTCTFYGTANSNQMMMEVMGLHIPGAAFVNPGTKLRQELTRAAVHRLAEIGWDGNDYRPLGRVVDEKAIVNAAVGLLATGGSTNHAIHLPAIARAAGILIDWEDLDRLSAAVPLIARIYPNGSGDVNQFQAAGGMAFTIATLLDAGLLHRDIVTVGGESLEDYAREPRLDRRETGLAGRAGRLSRRNHAATGKQSLQSRRRHALGRGQSRPRDLQDQRGRPVALDDRGSGASLLGSGCGAGGVQGGRARPRCRRGGALPGTAGEWHAGAAQAHAVARRAAGSWLPGGAGHRWAHVGRVGQGPGRNPRQPRGAGAAARIAKLRDGDIVRLCANRGELSALVDDGEWDAREDARRATAAVRHRARIVRPDAPRRRRRGEGRISDARGGWTVMELVAADIGGSHARFAVANVEGGRVTSLSEAITLRTVEHASLQIAWETFGRAVGTRLCRALAAIAVACPIAGEMLKLTNNPWIIRPAMISDEARRRPRHSDQRFRCDRSCGCSRRIRNICAISAGRTCRCPSRASSASSDPAADSVWHMCCVATAALMSSNAKAVISISLRVDEIEDLILARLRKRYRRVSAERVVSGSGLANIYEGLAAIEGRAVQISDDKALWTAALSGDDSLALAALDRFCLVLGSVAGNIALAHGANAVVIAGGLGLRIADLLPRSGFGSRFTAKGRFERMMSAIPVKIITHPQPGLFGAAAAFAEEHGR